MAFIDYYEVLGVPHNAGEDEIEKAYRALIRKHHPDMGGDTATAQRINEAHDALSKPGRRARYDAEYRYRRSRAGSAPSAAGYGGAPSPGGYDGAGFPGGYTYTTTSAEDWQPFDWRSDPDITGGTRLLFALFENLPTILGLIVMLFRATWTAVRIAVPVGVVGLLATALAMVAFPAAGTWIFVATMLAVLLLVAWTYVLALSNPVGFDKWSSFFWSGAGSRRSA